MGTVIGLIGLVSITVPIILKDGDNSSPKNKAEISSTSPYIGAGDNGAANAGGADSGFGETDDDYEIFLTTNLTLNSTTTNIFNTSTTTETINTTTTTAG